MLPSGSARRWRSAWARADQRERGHLSPDRLDQITSRLAAATEAAISFTLDHRRTAVEAAAERLRAAHTSEPPHRLARHAISHRGRMVAGSGALSALPAVLPGPGTLAEVGAAVGDVSYLTVSQVELVLMLAHLYRRDLGERELRKLDVLVALGVEAGVVKLHSGGVVEVAGVRHQPDQLRGAAGGQLARTVNGRLAAQVAARIARRRAHVILGREIPIVGIGIAAGYNLWSTRKLGAAAIDYFEHTD